MRTDQLFGVIPAFYACYDDDGEISPARTEDLATYLYEKNVQGLYVGGSSGECIYQNLEERKAVLTYVANIMRGKLALIAHVGAPSTRDSIALAKHAESLGYDAISAIPPIYFKLPDDSVLQYWNDIMEHCSLPFIAYNIPQTTGYTLTPSVFSKLIANKKVIGVKNSSMPTMDIERFKRVGGPNTLVFNGPDEQFVSGLMMGANGGIGGTYAAMPELFLKAIELVKQGDMATATSLQSDINEIIVKLCSCQGHMYAVIKDVLAIRGVVVGGVRKPLASTTLEDVEMIIEIVNLIDRTIEKYANS